MSSFVSVTITFRDQSETTLSVSNWLLQDRFLMVENNEDDKRLYFNWDEIMMLEVPIPPRPIERERPPDSGDNEGPE